MAELTVQQVSRTGLEATYAAATPILLTDEFNNDGRTFFHVKNGAIDCVITVAVAKTVDGMAVTPRTVTCTANEERFIGPFPTDIYNDADGHVNVTYDDVTNVTVAAIRLP